MLGGSVCGVIAQGASKREEDREEDGKEKENANKKRIVHLRDHASDSWHSFSVLNHCDCCCSFYIIHSLIKRRTKIWYLTHTCASYVSCHVHCTCFELHTTRERGRATPWSILVFDGFSVYIYICHTSYEINLANRFIRKECAQKRRGRNGERGRE